MHLSSSKPRLAGFQQNLDPVASRESPSLDMLAEMIKEEIRQASGLKQALDRVGFETECIATRMSALSMENHCCEESKEHGCTRPGAKTRANGKPKKQVQFVVPDDVRFRWLGIFQQPTESEDASGSEPETQMPGQSPVSNVAAISGAPVTATAATTTVATVGNALDGSASQATSPPHAARSNGLPVSPRSSLLLRKIANRTSSMDDEVIDNSYVFLPFTANSSVEAVYGGSRSDTRESSMLNSGASMSNLVKASAHHAHGSRSFEGLLDDRAVAGDAPGVNGAGHRGKYSTISGKNSRRIAAQLPMFPHEHSDPGEPMHAHSSETLAAPRVNNRNGAVSPPLASRSAFAQPSLATSKVTVSQRHSVSPEFAAAQIAQLQNDGPKTSRVDDKPPLVFRSGSAHSAVGLAPLPSSSARRRNSLDESSISSRGALRADLGSGSGDLLQVPAVPPSPRRSQTSGGLFRRVTTTGALRKHNQHAEYTNPGDGEHNGDDMGGSGIIGGTREFFKHRLWTRTHSNSTHLLNGAAQDGSAQTNGVGVLAKSGSEAAERPRKRSDAEVKSRDSS
ncbi:hypothetical protein GGH95_002710, partial [Coemansia sp. RSA 1836]